MMIKDAKGIERYSLPQKVYDMLMRIKEKITHEDQEVWVCFGGDTGTGKSLMSMRWMYPIFRGLNVNHVCFDKNEAIEAILTAKKGTGIILDEGISIMFSRSSMTKEGRLMAELITQIRQRNLAIFLNIPEVTTLDWMAQQKLNIYVHVWESRYKTGKKNVTFKGNASVYPDVPGHQYKTKMIQFLKKKKANPLKNTKKPAPWFTIKGEGVGEGHKKPWYPVDEKAYRIKKEAVLKKYNNGDKLTSRQEQLIKQRDRAIYFWKEASGLSNNQMGSRLEMPRTTVQCSLENVKHHLLDTKVH